jgi:predicted Rossmann fold flavoprotein
VVIGGGAAGFFGAIAAAERYPNARVTILEKARTVLSKVRVSGGGRCNVTHAVPGTAAMLKGYPRGERFLKTVFAQFNHADTVEWFARRGVPLKTEADGRMFPTTDSSETIIRCLLDAARRAGVEVRISSGVERVVPENGGFEVSLYLGETLRADRVLLTTGGQPNPAGYDGLVALGHAIVPPVPSLFTFNVPDSPLRALPGVSVPAGTVRLAGTKLSQTGPVLLTHWGFSGPAVLKLSAWGARELAMAGYRATALINWTGGTYDTVRAELDGFRQGRSNKQIGTLPAFGVPQRLWQALCAEAGVGETTRWAEAPAKALNRLAELLTNAPFQVQGKTTYKEEFVTCGGVSLSDVDPHTLESRRCPGLFLAGELLDIDGITGGYNFQAAWSTGYVAGVSVGR